MLAWVKPKIDNDYWTGAVGKAQNWPNRQYHMWLGNSNNQENTGGAFVHHTYTSDSCTNYAQNTPSGSVPFNQWTHVAIVLDSVANFQKTYLNSEEMATRIACGPVNNTQGPVSIGKNLDSGLSNFFNGTVDEYAIFNRALSQQEIQNLFNGLVAPQGSATVQLLNITPLSQGIHRVKVCSSSQCIPWSINV